MSYFTLFPLLYYPDQKGNLKLLTDITIRNSFLKNVKTEKNSYFLYEIEESERIENIADRYYGDPSLHWIIYYMNDIIDPFYDLPLGYSDFEEFLKNKYGEGNQSNVHHYELEDGTKVSQGTSGAVGISNREYERRINDSKRSIKILKRKYLDKVISEFQELISN